MHSLRSNDELDVSNHGSCSLATNWAVLDNILFVSDLVIKNQISEIHKAEVCQTVHRWQLKVSVKGVVGFSPLLGCSMVVLGLHRGVSRQSEVKCMRPNVNIQIVVHGEGFSPDIIIQRRPRTLSFSSAATLHAAFSAIASSASWKNNEQWQINVQFRSHQGY
jgi:hypothetical protein